MSAITKTFVTETFDTWVPGTFQVGNTKPLFRQVPNDILVFILSLTGNIQKNSLVNKQWSSLTPRVVSQNIQFFLGDSQYLTMLPGLKKWIQKKEESLRKKSNNPTFNFFGSETQKM